MTARPFLESLLVLAFVSGVSLTAGFYTDNDTMKQIGWFFLLMFLGIAMAGGFQLRRELKRRRRYERNRKGLL